MKHANITAAGVIPIYHAASGSEVLVLEQYGIQGTHWGFPKGKTEPGEELTVTALRELREEAGVRATLLDEATFTVTYSFTYEETIINKTVTYFIGRVDVPGLALRESEIKNGEWLDFTDARNRLSFESDRAMFDAVQSHLSKHPLDHETV